MSIAALDWAFECSVHGPAKAVLIALANHANNSGECWPSHERLAKHSGFVVRTVRYALEYLADGGFLSVQRTDGRPSKYTLRIAIPNEPLQDLHGVGRHELQPPPATNAEGGRQDVQQPMHQMPTNPQEPPKQPSLNHQTGMTLFGDQVGKQPPVLINGNAAAFDEFWSIYPRRLQGDRMVKEGKAAAQRAFAKAIRKTPPSKIIAAVKSYPFPLDRPQFIKQPAGWLNDERYLAEVDDPERVLSLQELDEWQEARTKEDAHGN